jgi:hypothetical protein
LKHGKRKILLRNGSIDENTTAHESLLKADEFLNGKLHISFMK